MLEQESLELEESEAIESSDELAGSVDELAGVDSDEEGEKAVEAKDDA